MPELFLLPAPWRQPKPLRSAAPIRWEHSNPLVLLAVEAPTDKPRSLRAPVTELRRRFPAFPILVWVMRPAGIPAHFLRSAAEAAIRALISGPPPFDVDQIRGDLTDDTWLGTDVARWFCETRNARDSYDGILIRKLLDATRQHATLAGVCASLRVKERTIEARMRRSTAFSAGEIVSLGVALRTILRLQRSPQIKPADLAHEFALSPDGLDSRTRRAFGLHAAAAQKLLGVAPLLVGWLHRRAT